MHYRAPWTHDELCALIPKLERDMAAAEADFDNEVKPLPPMTVPECEDYWYRLLNLAGERALTRHECFLFGQLLAVLKYAIRAEVLGKKGRYFVLSEEEIAAMVALNTDPTPEPPQ